MRWCWLCLGLLACADDGGSNGGGLDASLDAGGHDLDATVIADAGSEAGDMCRRNLQQVAVGSALHVQGDVVYPDPPPAGGNHNPCWAKWGVHDGAAVPDERWVHNLEHGGIVFLYHCPDGCQDEVDTMATFVGGRTQALLTAYDALPTRFAVVAWGYRLTTDCFDMPAFRAFYGEHVDHGPESIPDDPPRSCP